eukprot:CAMPEP_0117441960 /NCGR_PEP_ID=MMETSP0759-20121206/3902_1 /TAXON_ID=63605 /ORGANISM="Percolomonas cosmopolitus, Strain WS" /LENGTH=370 /DNA_ID=CAMNT_0005233827 /DNA_START=297 /DNA_END=1405 /DNA_ORIENTATION=+
MRFSFQRNSRRKFSSSPCIIAHLVPSLMYILFIILWNATTSPVQATTQYHQGYSYTLTQDNIDAAAAKTACENHEENLLWIADAAEMSWIVSNVTDSIPSDNIWIGLSKTGSWKWVHDSSTPEYTTPFSDSGSNQCAIMKSSVWTDVSCSGTQPYYICKGQYQCYSQPYASACNGHGECTQPDVCECVPEYSGQQCVLSVCYGKSAADPLSCSGQGYCISPDYCSCDSGYAGDECESPLCNSIIATDGSVCSSHGNCTEPDTCSCSTGYTGTDCEIPICNSIAATDGSVCSSHGTCATPDMCSCSTGYTGTDCQVPICNSIAATDASVCSSHGNCTSSDTCSCFTGYTGTDCQVLICNSIAATDGSVCSS